METDVTRRLARFAVEFPLEEMPAQVRHEGARSLLNWLGCTLGGSSHETVETALRALRDFAGAGPATLIGRRERLDPMHATLVNGISSAVLDFDATQAKRTNIHPVGPVAPALLALAERRPVDGAAFLHALVLGVEVACRVANSVFDRDNPGWHVTGVAGGLGTAAAAGRLLGLDEQRMIWALGIAATQAAGLREMYGTMCKSFTPGRTAQNGLTAALLAESGFTSAERGIEGSKALAQVLARRPVGGDVLDGLGDQFEICRNTYKPFPCAIVSHPTIDGCLRLRRAHGFTADTINSVELYVSPQTLNLAGNPEPTTGLASKFSVHHAAAVALLWGQAGPKHFEDACVSNPEVAALRKRVSPKIGPELRKDEAYVSLLMVDGRALAVHVEHALGSLEHPMSDDDLEAKFKGLAEGLLPSDQTDALVHGCWTIERLAEARTLAQLAVPRSGAPGLRFGR